MSLNSDILTFNININSNLVVKSLSGNLILSRFFLSESDFNASGLLTRKSSKLFKN